MTAMTAMTTMTETGAKPTRATAEEQWLPALRGVAAGGRTALATGTPVVGGAVVIGVAAWTMADTTPTRAGDVAIKAHNVAYQPKVVQTPGGTVDIRVSNGDFVRHTFVLDGQHMSLSIPAGKARRTAVALQPGRYRFHCDIKGHENMAGT